MNERPMPEHINYEAVSADPADIEPEERCPFETNDHRHRFHRCSASNQGR